MKYTVIATRYNMARKWLVVRYEKGRNSYLKEFEVPKKASDSELEELIVANAPEEVKSRTRAAVLPEPTEEGDAAEQLDDVPDPDTI